MKYFQTSMKNVASVRSSIKTGNYFCCSGTYYQFTNETLHERVQRNDDFDENNNSHQHHHHRQISRRRSNNPFRSAQKIHYGLDDMHLVLIDSHEDKETQI